MNSKIENAVSGNRTSNVQSLIEVAKPYREKLDLSNSAKDLRKTILDHFLHFSNSFIDMGSSEYQKLNDMSRDNELAIYLMHFRLPETFKDLLFLHRDVLLQLGIARHKNLEGVVNKDAIKAHFVESREVLAKAVDDFSEKILLEYNGALRLAKTKGGIRAKLKHPQNPWEIYKDQFLAVQEQLIQIDIATNKYTKVLQVFDSIREQTREMCRLILKEAQDIISSVEMGVERLQELKDISEIEKILPWLDDELSKLDLDIQFQENFTTFLESKTQSLGSVTLPIETSEGSLLTKKIDLNKATQKWLDYTVLPYFIELCENRLNMVTYYRHSLLNLDNSLTVDKSSKSLEALPSQVEGHRIVGDTLKNQIEKQEKVVHKIQEIIDVDFLATNIYQEEDFLELSLQSSLVQFTSQKVGLFEGLGKKIKNVFSKVGSKYEENVLATPAKKLSQAMRCIEHRMLKEENAHYDILFLNKNFVGDLFLVPREEAEAKMTEAVAEWRSGLHKSILVLGNPLCGKSTFMEKMAKDHFGKQILFLKVDSDVVVEGRKFKTTKDLGEALSQVKKSLYNTRPIVMINDIEAWRDKDHTFLQNVQDAINFIESESEHVLVMIGTSHMMRNHLDSRLPFSNSFSTVIDIEHADFQTIYKAILFRNGASHRILIDQDGTPLSDKQIEQSIQKLCRTFNYNLGEVLQAWTYGTKMVTDNKVIYKDMQGTFADFFTAREVLILKYIVLYGYVNEVILKDFIGKRFDSNYRSSLRRLINTKVLLRDEEGHLRINSVLNHDIREILKYRGILK